MVSPTLVDIGLFAIVLVVLVGPFMVKKIEHNLEAFLFVMGVLAVTIAGFESRAVLEAIGYNHEQIAEVGWNMKLITEAALEPVVKGIVPAVLVAGLLFHYGRDKAQRAMTSILDKVSIKVVVFLMVVILGLASSVITAIISALLLVELVNCMPTRPPDEDQRGNHRLFLYRPGSRAHPSGRASVYHRRYQASGSSL